MVTAHRFLLEIWLPGYRIDVGLSFRLSCPAREKQINADNAVIQASGGETAVQFSCI